MIHSRGYIMAGATIHMTATKQKTLQEVREQLLKIQCIEEVSATEQIINDVKFIMKCVKGGTFHYKFTSLIIISTSCCV